jgi:ubiquinone/menaquinone biosynthesis C-methylase UbiE
VSENGAMRARANGFELVLAADAMYLPFDQGEFDAALCIEVFEHLFEPLAAAKEILRILRPGAVMLATVPNTAYWQRRVELGLHGLWNPLGDHLSLAEPWRDPHIRFFTPSTLGKMMERAGFERVRFGGHSTVFSVRPKSWCTRTFQRFHTSRAYQTLEQVFPNLLASKAHAVGYKPR